MRSRLVCSLFALGALVAGEARAQPKEPPPPEATKAPAPAEQSASGSKTANEDHAADAKPKPKAAPQRTPDVSSPKRPLPDYGGAPEPKTAGDALLWVPRVAFFPAWLASEYVLRRPLGAVVSWAERHEIVSTLKDWFTFGPNGEIGIVPTAILDFGVRPSVGVYHFWDNFLFKGNELRSHLGYGGTDWYRATFYDRVPLDDNSHVSLRFEFWQRPDRPFYGLGPRSLEQNRSRFEETSVDGNVTLHAELNKYVTVHAIVGLKTEYFNANGNCCSDPPLSALVESGQLTLPPGFEGYTAYRQTLLFAADSRRPRPAPGSGFRLELHAEHDVDVRDPEDVRWIKYGGTFGGFLDVTGKNHVLALSLDMQFVDPTGKTDEVPFVELAQIGGYGPMRGFLYNRAFDRSAAVATLEYRYPIWAFLDASLQLAVGNVFDKYLEDFSPKLLRVSWSAGIRSIGTRDHSFDFMVGQGSETFADGARLNQARFLFGATRAF